ncbi:MAG: zf-HC2 domain-containing protein [Candidatus Acidiferrum sp.]
MNCQDIIHELSTYLDGELDASMKRELEQHLEDCSECKLVVNQTKKTIQIFCDCEPVELPGDVRNRLHEALRRKLGEARQ